MKAKEIQDLIDYINETGLEEVNIKTGDFELKVRRSAKVSQVVEALPAAQPVAAAPAPAVAAATPSAPSEAEASSEGNYVTVKAPMIGTFYRSSNPESDAFVEVGSKISKGQTICIVEAMKLFNEIESEVSGTVVKVLVDNAQPVEYDQPLFLVDPS
ncbi:MAG: acetyl-CoA carboxylase biotin carboxyl carrier protein [Cyclobacteriaceae bacterium]